MACETGIDGVSSAASSNLRTSQSALHFTTGKGDSHVPKHVAPSNIHCGISSVRLESSPGWHRKFAVPLLTIAPTIRTERWNQGCQA